MQLTPGSICALALLFAAGPKILGAQPITVARTNYHGWADSIVLGNGTVEAVIVPAIGRVMQFRFAGETDGPFWENRALDGQLPDPRSSEWANLGGDKTWPAPQEDWPKIAGRGWPPPPAFDSMPVEARVDGDVVTLVSPVDPHYGIRTWRQIHLAPGSPVMSISTTYEKVEGEPRKVSVWIITQLQHPVGVYAPVPARSLFAQGYNKQSPALPMRLEVKDGLLSLQRDPKASHKIGSDAGCLLWVGENHVVRIDSPRVPQASYPDQQSSAEIYTHPDPLAYIELEMLGPLQTLKAGDTLERTCLYTLLRRSEPDAETEARKLLRVKSGASTR